jgi:predicted 3-demethylubiquinone-9 3-methyltransferase (glyoxalase superfamily)
LSEAIYCCDDASMNKLAPFLWFNANAEEAPVSVFPRALA